MAGRVIVLVTALLVAVLGAVLVFVYADRAVQESQADLELVEVLVATEDIPAGTPVAEELVVLTERPLNALPEEYLDELESVRGLVTSSALLRNDVLSPDRLSDPTASEELQIGPQELAITIPLDDPNRVARFVEPGDLVAVFLTRQVAQEAVDGETGGGSAVATTQLLVPEVRVVGVGSRTAPDAEGTGDVSAALVTVSVLQADAERLILAQSLGSLYLGLLTDGPDGSAVTRGGGTTAGSLLQDAP